MISKDKLKHFLLSFVLTAVIYWLIRDSIIAIAIVLVIGLIKELYDQMKKKNTTGESLTDVLSNVVGITGGIIFVRIFF